MVTSDAAASGGSHVGYVGNGAANTLRFNNVTVPAAGRYRMGVAYANAELGPGASNYNTNVVDRYADISVNGAAAKRVYFRNTLGWSNYWTTLVDVDPSAGATTIQFGNSSAWAPNIDRIGLPDDTDMIPLTCQEIARLLATMLFDRDHPNAHRWAWSAWRRRRQHRAPHLPLPAARPNGMKMGTARRRVRLRKRARNRRDAVVACHSGQPVASMMAWRSRPLAPLGVG